MIPRLYVPHTIEAGSPLKLDEGQRRYLLRTLRLTVGAPLTLFGPSGEEGEWQGELIRCDTPAEVRPIRFLPLKKESPLQITLIQGLAKGSATELVIQKAVELGASTLIPLVSQRSVRRVKADRNESKLKRWNTIIQEAAEQCGRVRLPVIHPPMGWKELAPHLADGPRYLFWEEEKQAGITLRDLPHPGRTVTLLVGPEGGLGREEVELARETLGFKVVSLGPRILRTETAGLAVLSGCQVLWGDMG
ncbi:MAG: 16S rRNA (uracil(1498)-N(3))-methyltransferase [Magnetococcales bacterium]|nr:16S rRNA (uracil(1498)-N(3))-methyltransferase [Magnetococcales bacterium]